MTSLSKHFMATDVSATARLSFRQVTLVILGTGTMVVCLEHVVIIDSVRNRLNMSVKHSPAGQRMLGVHVHISTLHVLLQVLYFGYSLARLKTKARLQHFSSLAKTMACVCTLSLLCAL